MVASCCRRATLLYTTTQETSMRTLRYGLLLGAFLSCVTPMLGSCAEPDSKGFVRVTPDQLDWKEVPKGHGIQMAVVSGNPTQPGIYVIRVKFPPGVMSSPHYHGEDRHVVVLKGTWYTGTDDSWDPAKTVGLPTGSYMKHPAGGVHFDGAKDEEVMVQIIGQGPSSTTILFPAEGDFGSPHKLH
jgi:quercetin dioxygenase-like cupin family protein